MCLSDVLGIDILNSYGLFVRYNAHGCCGTASKTSTNPSYLRLGIGNVFVLLVGRRIFDGKQGRFIVALWDQSRSRPGCGITVLFFYL